MRKLGKMFIGVFMMVAATAQSYGAIGVGHNYWAASADIVDRPGGGIVVVDSTHSACQKQFEKGMATKTAIHGWVFTNIKNCSYIVTGTGVVGGGGIIGHTLGLEEALQLNTDLQVVEERYEIAERIVALETAGTALEKALKAKEPRRRLTKKTLKSLKKALQSLEPGQKAIDEAVKDHSRRNDKWPGCVLVYGLPEFKEDVDISAAWNAYLGAGHLPPSFSDKQAFNTLSCKAFLAATSHDQNAKPIIHRSCSVIFSTPKPSGTGVNYGATPQNPTVAKLLGCGGGSVSDPDHSED